MYVCIKLQFCFVYVCMYKIVILLRVCMYVFFNLLRHMYTHQVIWATHTHTYTNPHTHTYTNPHTHTHTYMYTHQVIWDTHTHTYTNPHTHTHTYMYTHQVIWDGKYCSKCGVQKEFCYIHTFEYLGELHTTIQPNHLMCNFDMCRSSMLNLCPLKDWQKLWV